MNSDSQEAPNNPALEVVGEAAEPAAPIEAESVGGRGGGLRKVFWIAAFAVVLLAVAALGTTGYLGQREMRDRIAGLEGDLAATHDALSLEQAALRAERARADGLQTTMGRVNELSVELAISLRELQALTGAAPLDDASRGSAPSGDETSDATPGLGALEEAVADDAAADSDASTPSAGNGGTGGEAPELDEASPQAPATLGSAAIEGSIPEGAAPSILETPSAISPEFDQVPAAAFGDALSDLPEAGALDAAVADAGDELPAVSSDAAASSAATPEVAATGGADGAAALPPEPLWRQALARLRALAPSE
jgi:hypothetical protein